MQTYNKRTTMIRLFDHVMTYKADISEVQGWGHGVKWPLLHYVGGTKK